MGKINSRTRLSFIVVMLAILINVIAITFLIIAVIPLGAYAFSRYDSGWDWLLIGFFVRLIAKGLFCFICLFTIVFLLELIRNLVWLFRFIKHRKEIAGRNYLTKICNIAAGALVPNIFFIVDFIVFSILIVEFIYLNGGLYGITIYSVIAVAFISRVIVSILARVALKNTFIIITPQQE